MFIKWKIVPFSHFWFWYFGYFCLGLLDSSTMRENICMNCISFLGKHSFMLVCIHILHLTVHVWQWRFTEITRDPLRMWPLLCENTMCPFLGLEQRVLLFWIKPRKQNFFLKNMWASICVIKGEFKPSSVVKPHKWKRILLLCLNNSNSKSCK